jgi:8-oxo-dGTP pyrophosphatase MutT (NUDIX family)
MLITGHADGIPGCGRRVSELVDIVDADDQVVRTVTRQQMRAERLRHRAVFVAVMHPDGRLLVHQRSELKDLWPGRWDLVGGGVVASGESYDEAARREVAEEIGIEGAPQPLDGGGPYDDDDVSLIGRCYLLVHPGPFTFADGEVVRAEWVHVQSLRSSVGDGRQYLPDSWALLLPLLLPLR